jgi:oligoendopeptidase F
LKAISPSIEETWDLTHLFADDATFERAKRELGSALLGLSRWRGKLTESAALLAEALDEIDSSRKRFALLRSYSSLKSDADTRVAAYQAMRESVDLLATEFARQVAFVRPEILAAEPERLEQFISEEPRLEPHAFFIRDLIRHRPHVLAPPEERILAEAGLVTRTASSLYEVLHNVDLPRPEVTLSDGECVRLTPVAMARHRSTSRRDDRATIFPAYYGAYAAFRHTLGHNLYAAIKAHLFRTRVRGYASCLSASLFGDNVPVRVYHNLTEQVRRHLPLLHRYLELRRRALGLDQLEYSDLHCPILSSSPKHYAPREARVVVVESLRPLGSTYTQALDDAFDSRWIDWHPSDGKRSGAYSSGWAYDQHPYVLLNFVGDYESVSTVAHEMGHAMHSHFSNRAQPFATADYSIFVAEVASTLNESLLSARSIEKADSREEKLFLLASYLDGMRATLFRQTMFAEFELRIHETAERGEVLTGEGLDALYLELLREYHAHDRVVAVADVYAAEWAAIPHFYYDFYVYQYATGIVAATALAEALTRDEGAAERYHAFLCAGGSDHPLELLRRAGVDLESAEPYRVAFAGLERRLDQLESLLDGDASG